jgi:hypothetical protein
MIQNIKCEFNYKTTGVIKIKNIKDKNIWGNNI